MIRLYHEKDNLYGGNIASGTGHFRDWICALWNFVRPSPRFIVKCSVLFANEKKFLFELWYRELHTTIGEAVCMENKNERICCFFLRQLQFFVLVILLGRALCISFVIRANYVVSIVQTTGNNSRRHKWCRCTFCAFAANKRKLLEQVYKCCALADNRLRSRAYSKVVPIKRRTEKITITSTATMRCK